MVTLSDVVIVAAMGEWVIQGVVLEGLSMASHGVVGFSRTSLY